MDDIKGVFGQVSSALTEEQVIKVGSILKTLENEMLDLNNSLAAAKVESRERRIENGKLKTTIEGFEISEKNWETEKAGYEEKINDPANTEKIANLEAFKSGVLQKQRAKFISSFDGISKHANWANAKSLYNIPTETEKKTVDGKEVEVLKWDTIDENQMEININKLDEHNTVNLFGESSKPTPTHIKGKNAITEHEAPKTVNEATGNLENYRQQQGA